MPRYSSTRRSRGCAPTFDIELSDGVGEIDAAALFEV